MSRDHQIDTPEALHTMNRLRAVECTSCGMIFAVQQCVYLDRLHEHGSLVCPSGHAILLDDDSENPANLVCIDVELLAEVE